MSIEVPEVSPERTKAIEAAKQLINETVLLERDPLTREVLDNAFVVDEREVDPGEWLHERLEFLRKEEPVQATRDRIEKDFKDREGN